MGQQNSVEYYLTRERRERTLAAAAANPAIALIHAEMAARYLALVNDASIASSPRMRSVMATAAH